MNVRTEIGLPDDLRAFVKAESLRRRISYAEVVRRALRRLENGDRLVLSAEPRFPDARELLERALRNLGGVMSGPRSLLRWGAVSRLTGLGSTYAAALCRAVGLDPDEEIGPTEWEAFEALFGETFDEERWEEITGEDPPPEDERHRREKNTGDSPAEAFCPECDRIIDEVGNCTSGCPRSELN